VVEPDGDIDTTAEGAAASVAHSLLTFNEAIERILEVVVVLIVASDGARGAA
jgi:hypothetical protein